MHADITCPNLIKFSMLDQPNDICELESFILPKPSELGSEPPSGDQTSMATASSELSGKAALSRNVLITGVSKGLGRALALELARRGHTIIGCSRNQNKLDSLQEELSSCGPASNPSPNKHLLFNIDLRSDSRVEEVARAVSEKNLVPDIIVNNAGMVNRQAEMWEIDVEDFDNVIDTNVKGTANVLRHFLPLMIPRKQGIIVNMSSDAGRNGYELLSPYCSSKWAVEGLTKCIAKELPKGMAIVALHPGVIFTDMLVSCLGDLASQYQSPEHWALKAATMILDLTTTNNSASLTVEDPGHVPPE